MHMIYSYAYFSFLLFYKAYIHCKYLEMCGKSIAYIGKKDGKRVLKPGDRNHLVLF